MISQAQLLQNYDSPESQYFLLDVRSLYEFEGGHIPGSINIPAGKLEENLNKIPKEKQIVTICNHGIRSGYAEAFLREKGYRADSLTDGLEFWKGQWEKKI
jgi:rhodanese-related sulfurtransferase